MNPTSAMRIRPPSIARRGLALLSLCAAAWLSGPESAHAAWPMGIGGTGADEVRVVKYAATGDIFVAGHYRGSLEISTTTGVVTLVSRGGQDIFVARLNAAGQTLWARSAGGVNSDDTVNDLVLDEGNNVYIVGEFYARATFGSTDLRTVDGDDNDSDGYVAKLDVTGAWQWARGFGSHLNDTATSIVALPGAPGLPPTPESVVVAGSFTQSARFRTPAGAQNQTDFTVNGVDSLTTRDLYVARINAQGEWVWALGRGAAASGNDEATRLTVDGNNRLWLTGRQATGSSTLVQNRFDANTNGWTIGGAGKAAIWYQADTYNDLSLMLYGSNNPANATTTVTTNALAGASTARLEVSIDVQRGLWDAWNYTRSDFPDSGDDLYFEYYAGGTWKTLERFRGGVLPGAQRFYRRGATAYTITDPQAMNGDLRFRLRHVQGTASTPDRFTFWWIPGALMDVPFPDAWHVNNVEVRRIGVQQPFVVSVGNATSTTPAFAQLTQLPAALDVADIAVSPDGNRIVVSGERVGNVNFGTCGTFTGTGAFVAWLEPSGNALACRQMRTASAGRASSVVLDTAGNAYIAGHFSGTAEFFSGTDGSLTSSGGEDMFIASVDSTAAFAWRWVTGGDRFDAVDGIPARAGGGGADRATRLSVGGPGGNLYVGGRFTGTAVFGEADQLESRGLTDGVVLTLGRDGRFPREERWTIGVPVTPPPGAKFDDMVAVPDFRINGVSFNALEQKLFVWAPPRGSEPAQLIPLQPATGVEVRWRVQGESIESPNRISAFGRLVWPTEPCGDTELNGCYQVHVAGAPVEAEPPTGEYKVQELVNPGSEASMATYSGGRFTATQSGYAVLVYINGPTVNPTAYPTVVEVVRSLAYDNIPQFVDNVPVEIGRKIVDSYHTEPNRTGFVVNENAYYDGHGADAAYNRVSRTGAIIPVNRYSSGRVLDQGRELVVAWYRAKGKGVYWPDKAVRYAPHWPIDPDRIIVASEQGSEMLGQTRLEPARFPSLTLYIQNDPALPGYNPNDEHAMLAPSTMGSGHQAAFALRADFGSNLVGEQAAASDPYVLLRYFDTASQERRFRVYKVEATGAGFTRFRYSGVAGTTVSPPYPLRLLQGCAETSVTGQAANDPQPPAPFFKDYKNQLWGKSAGSGSVRYHYPVQPGFFTDIDNNNDNDLEQGQCVAWMPRLPEAQGGTPSQTDPIEVDYDIAWPEESPLLVSGETLMTPKRGLPAIYTQAAVEVVYDAIQDEQPDAAPHETVAQLIDPTNPRWVVLDAIPETIASEMGTDGQVSISGSADGSIKLPVSVRDRLSYDPMNRRLSVSGLYDPTIAGEPLLLLNVLSLRDRVTLKRLDGGDGSEAATSTKPCRSAGCSWDEAVEALFRLSRNPNGITKVCERSSVNSANERVCDIPTRPVRDTDVLIGYQDANNDGILEPFQAVGVSPALTAGASQGNGYLTLAFNNDPSLNPLPVSLEIIKVGCLVSPEPPATPVINSTYQGQINVIAPDNIFDEQLVLRHGGDFGGNPDALEFDWYFHPDMDGTPPMPLPDPENGQLNGWIRYGTGNAQGAIEISIEGANIQTLSDNWFVARYRGLPACNNTSRWSLWAGQPGATPTNPRAQLASGWVKRVLARLNPFEARVQDFGASETNTYASMLIQLGERYSGPIALNNDPDNLNSIGLIEAYTTVMRRALQLSADATPPIDYGPANSAILLVASRLVDFYTLLGHEAYADAQDPTVAISTENGAFSLTPTIFNFQNQLDSLLTEELVLLRGRDDANGPVAAAPVYNRLFWNFTTGDGEVAYALSYDVTDQNVNGVVDEFDARIMFPQGHGDAWGHYLTGTKIYYELLRHPFFSWDPRPEAVPVAGVPIQVDFLDERQFAETAAAKARTGAEVVNLTYRAAYVADPNGQWQGYDDTNPQRAWGLSEWGRRAGMGAYFDWVTTNAILPDVDPDPSHVGIQRIERGTVPHIDEIYGHYAAIQGQVDKADAGLNPLGLAQNVVPFDFDPTQLDRFNKTQFEQVYDRAMTALNNALSIWDYANRLSNQLRRTQESVDALYEHAIDEETDYANQLIDIFGYPYVDDIGPGGTYPAGYNGPDLYHYMYIDLPALAGTAFDFDGGIGNGDIGINRLTRTKASYTPMPNGVGFFGVTPTASGTPRTGANGQSCTDQPLSEGCALGDAAMGQTLEVELVKLESPDFGVWYTKPPEWVGQRRAPGRLQQILQQMLEARIALKQATLEYDKLRLDIFAQMQTAQATFNISESNLAILNRQRNALLGLTVTNQIMTNGAIVARRVGSFLERNFDTMEKCIPGSTIGGLAVGGDFLSGVRCAIHGTGGVPKFVLDTVADGMDIVANATDAAKEDVQEMAGIDTFINDQSLELYNLQGEIDALVREEPLLRAEIFARAEAIKQLVGDYQATLAEGQRVLEQLVVFRRDAAEDTQIYRYRDMAFRIFRNDALQKYRASFELAARYVYLAAAAYDYETNLLGGDSQAGQTFLTNVVRERSLGQVLNGQPMPGSQGLAGTLAQLKLNFDVLKGQMGFNNPQVETNRFSLRRELFRIPDGPEGDEQWRRTLESFRVDNLWAVPEFRRYARPFAPESAGPQPGLVIEFSTNVNFGLNFFGWDLGPRDSSYDSSQFATRIRSVGAWFADYADLPLADDPRIYIFPVGADVLRARNGNDFETREWQVMDQAIPVPFPIGSSDLDNYAWNPLDSLSGSATELRRYGRIKAYHFSEPFDDTQVTSDSRLVGRSVWNRRWMIIIPGGTFLNDPVEGLDTFIHGQRIPGGGTARDGDGVEDIRIFFKTYAYSGN